MEWSDSSVRAQSSWGRTRNHAQGVTPPCLKQSTYSMHQIPDPFAGFDHNYTPAMDGGSKNQREHEAK